MLTRDIRCVSLISLLGLLQRNLDKYYIVLLVAEQMMEEKLVSVRCVNLRYRPHNASKSPSMLRSTLLEHERCTEIY